MEQARKRDRERRAERRAEGVEQRRKRGRPKAAGGGPRRSLVLFDAVLRSWEWRAACWRVEKRKKRSVVGCLKNGGNVFTCPGPWAQQLGTAQETKRIFRNNLVPWNFLWGKLRHRAQLNYTKAPPAWLGGPPSTARPFDGRPVFWCWWALANSARRGRGCDRIHYSAWLGGGIARSDANPHPGAPPHGPPLGR